jgi:hypothetical protein
MPDEIEGVTRHQGDSGRRRLGEDADIVGGDDRDSIDDVRRSLLRRRHSKCVTNSYIFKAAKKTVAMAGDPDIALLSGKGCSGNSPHAAIQPEFIDSVEHRDFDAGSRNAQYGEGRLEVCCE